MTAYSWAVHVEVLLKMTYGKGRGRQIGMMILEFLRQLVFIVQLFINDITTGGCSERTCQHQKSTQKTIVL